MLTPGESSAMAVMVSQFAVGTWTFCRSVRLIGGGDAPAGSGWAAIGPDAARLTSAASVMICLSTRASVERFRQENAQRRTRRKEIMPVRSFARKGVQEDRPPECDASARERLGQHGFRQVMAKS